MNSETQHRLREIFCEAVEIEEASARAAFLSRACGSDLSLRQRVDQLLAADDGGGHEDPMSSLGAAKSEMVGERVGRYKLLQQIGEGGCGVVFMAEQEEPVHRLVALKVIKLGMDTRQVVARFEAERQALALMDHPNIAKVLDAGASESGRPYFVMELVRGVRITEYCDLHRLDPRQRIELFAQVCNAVQHAHQKGIIHRDLKPSNILVTEAEGSTATKIIDFGIAKAIEGRLTDQTIFTAMEQLLGTPAYMSPEQAATGVSDIDTRSDIYSLGVLLYELLTGRTPFDQKELVAAGLDAMRQTIREKEPPRPSTKLSALAAPDLTSVAQARQSEPPGLIHMVRGDLDWIVMKCLDKDRARRYATANGLAADLERHLKDEPVLARPPSRLYEFQKTVRRHKFGFAATLAVIASLMIGMVANLRESHRAREAETVSRRNAYVADMRMAQRALREGDLRGSRELLRRYFSQSSRDTDLRGWEWRHLAWENRGDDHISVRGHSNVIRNVRFLDNERLLMTTHGEHPFIYNIKTGFESLGFTNQTIVGRRSLALSPKREGLYFIADYQFGTDVYFTKLRGGPESKLHFLEPMERVAAIDISPDERFLAIGCKGEAALWDIDSRTKTGRIPLGDDRSRAVRFSPDGRILAVGDESGQLRFWSTEQRQILATVTNAHKFGTSITAVEFSPNGERVVSVGVDGYTKVWDTATRSLVAELPHARTTFTAAFSHNGRWLATAGADDCVRVWETASWRIARMLRGHADLVQTVDFSPDDHWLASGSRNGEIKVWACAPDELAVAERSAEVNAFVDFAPDGSGFARIAAFSVATREVEIWSLPSFQMRQRISIHDLDLISCRLLPGGTVLALGCSDGSIHIRGAAGGNEIVVTNAHAGAVQCLEVTGDGSHLFSYGGTNGEFRIWQLPEMKPLAQRHSGEWTQNMLGSADGRLMAFFQLSGEIVLWDLPSMTKRTRWQAFPTITDCVGAFSNDSRWLATGANDGSARIWDIDGRQPPITLNSLFTTINSLAFSPDGTRLAVGAPDDVKIFDTATGEEMASFVDRDTYLRFAQNGESLVGISSQGPVMYHAPPLNQLRFDWLTVSRTPEKVRAQRSP